MVGAGSSPVFNVKWMGAETLYNAVVGLVLTSADDSHFLLRLGASAAKDCQVQRKK
jgi:hypothetical protein